MIDSKAAVASALTYVRDLYPDGELKFLRVEEIELSEDARMWTVTLGWVERAIRKTGPALSSLSGPAEILALPRVYKRFAIDAETGAVRSMKIRKVG